MLEQLDGRFRVLQHEGPASPEECRALTARFPRMPDEYLRLAREATAVELEWDGKRYVRIWNPDGCLEMDEGYGVSESIPGAIPIGDNGGSAMLVYMEGDRGPGLYRVGFGYITGEGATWVAPSLQDFLTRGEGAAAFAAA